MKRSVVGERIEELTGHSQGSVVCAADFASITNPRNAATQLSRLAAAGRITRLLRGIYWVAPQQAQEGAGAPTKPELSQVAKAIARANHWVIAPTGALALAQLGLPGGDAQAALYVSSGPYASYDYEGTPITFKHVAERYLGNLSPKTQLVVQILRSQGHSFATNKNAQLIAKALTLYEVETLAKEAAQLPPWIAAFAKSVQNEKQELDKRSVAKILQERSEQNRAAREGGNTPKGGQANAKERARLSPEEAIDQVKLAWDRFFTHDVDLPISSFARDALSSPIAPAPLSPHPKDAAKIITGASDG